jgi:hypothetical protein
MLAICVFLGYVKACYGLANKLVKQGSIYVLLHFVQPTHNSFILVLYKNYVSEVHSATVTGAETKKSLK